MPARERSKGKTIRIRAERALNDLDRERRRQADGLIETVAYKCYRDHYHKRIERKQRIGDWGTLLLFLREYCPRLDQRLASAARALPSPSPVTTDALRRHAEYWTPRIAARKPLGGFGRCLAELIDELPGEREAVLCAVRRIYALKKISIFKD